MLYITIFKIQNENGKTYTVKEKKPFYKKWQFWLLIVVITIGFASCSNSSNKNSNTSNESTSKTEKASNQK